MDEAALKIQQHWKSKQAKKIGKKSKKSTSKRENKTERQIVANFMEELNNEVLNRGLSDKKEGEVYI